MFHQPEFRCLLVQHTCTGQFFVALLKCVPSNNQLCTTLNKLSDLLIVHYCVLASNLVLYIVYCDTVQKMLACCCMGIMVLLFQQAGLSSLFWMHVASRSSPSVRARLEVTHSYHDQNHIYETILYFWYLSRSTPNPEESGRRKKEQLIQVKLCLILSWKTL